MTRSLSFDDSMRLGRREPNVPEGWVCCGYDRSYGVAYGADHGGKSIVRAFAYWTPADLTARRLERAGLFDPTRHIKTVYFAVLPDGERGNNYRHWDEPLSAPIEQLVATVVRKHFEYMRSVFPMFPWVVDASLPPRVRALP